jgi:BASS family bile acid:Na+ symporter
MDLATLILIAVRVSVFLSVLAMGLETTWQEATYFFRNRREFLRAILSLDVIMPLVAVVFVSLLNLQPAVKIALVALSVSPIPPILPRKEFKAGGSREYTLGLLVFAAGMSLHTKSGLLSLERLRKSTLSKRQVARALRNQNNLIV